MKKKIVSVISLFIVFIVIGGLIIYNKSINKDIYKDSTNKNTSKVPGMVSLMLETKAGSGEYKVSNEASWPTSGYEFNSMLSRCENGGTITWNDDKGSVTVRIDKSDKCYAYFDVLPPDVSVSVSNRPTTYGKLGTINCTGGSATYNQKYNRIEVSSIDNKFTTCPPPWVVPASPVIYVAKLTFEVLSV